MQQAGTAVEDRGQDHASQIRMSASSIPPDSTDYGDGRG